MSASSYVALFLYATVVFSYCFLRYTSNKFAPAGGKANSYLDFVCVHSEHLSPEYPATTCVSPALLHGAHLPVRAQADNFRLHLCDERHQDGGPVEGGSGLAGRDG